MEINLKNSYEFSLCLSLDTYTTTIAATVDSSWHGKWVSEDTNTASERESLYWFATMCTMSTNGSSRGANIIHSHTRSSHSRVLQTHKKSWHFNFFNLYLPCRTRTQHNFIWYLFHIAFSIVAYLCRRHWIGMELNAGWMSCRIVSNDNIFVRFFFLSFRSVVVDRKLGASIEQQLRGKWLTS